MSNVTLSIGGRAHTVACAEGEEAHVQRLGELIDAKLQDLPNLSGQSEARTLLFAALLLADEVHDLNRASPARPSPASPSAALGENLEALAQRLERLAARLEGTG